MRGRQPKIGFRFGAEFDAEPELASYPGRLWRRNGLGTTDHACARNSIICPENSSKHVVSKNAV